MTTTTNEISLNELWESIPISTQIFHPESLMNLPAMARLYLEHAIAPGAKLAFAARLWMQGEIQLEQKWHSFKGEEVICWQRGTIWQAKTWINSLPVSGSDRVVDGIGHSQWKALGLAPLVDDIGFDVTRSAIGRMHGESVWLPTALCHPDVSWTVLDTTHVQANFTVLGEQVELILTIDRSGRLEQVKYLRWGNPEGAAYRYVDFGGLMSAETTFGDYTIPTGLNLGWFFNGKYFENGGEFFRCTINRVIYR
jgi:hypothetical protein